MAQAVTGMRPHYHVTYELRFNTAIKCQVTLAIHTALTEPEAVAKAEECLTLMVHGQFVWSHLQTERRE